MAMLPLRQFTGTMEVEETSDRFQTETHWSRSGSQRKRSTPRAVSRTGPMHTVPRSLERVPKEEACAGMLFTTKAP